MTITVDDLPGVLEKHRLWLRSESGGTRANLTGANLTGANLDGANLTGANLTGANLDGANLTGANMRDGIVIHRSPLQISGLPYRITIWDCHMEIGCQFHRLSEWDKFDDAEIARMDGAAARRFWSLWKAPLLAMARADGRDFS